MESIAVTKPDMGLLSRERLILSPFGALAQAFSEELLSRAGFEEGRWPFVPLDLLEEGEIAVPAPPVQPVVQVDLSLVLQALRQTESRTEREKITERIVERIIRLREREYLRTQPEPKTPQPSGQGPLREADRAHKPSTAAQTTQAPRPGAVQQSDRAQKPGTAAQTTQAPQPGAVQQSDRAPKPGDSRETVSAPERTVAARNPFALQQNFYSTVNQHIQFTVNLRQSFSAQPGSAMFRQAAPGGAGKRSQALSLQFQELTEAGRTASGIFAEPLDIPRPAGTVPPSFGAETAPETPGWQRREHSARLADRRDVRRMAPEELFYPESTAEGVSASGARAEDGTRRSVRQAARRTGIEPAAQTDTPDRKQDAGMLPPGRTSAVFQPTRQSQSEFEDTASEGGENLTAPSDGLHTAARSAQASRQTERARQLTQSRRDGIQITTAAQDIRLTGEEPLDAAVKAAEQAVPKPESAQALTATPVYDPELTYRTPPEGERGVDTPPGPPASGAAHPHSSAEEAARPRASEDSTTPTAGISAREPARSRTSESGTTQAADSPAKEPARSRTSEDGTTQAADSPAREPARSRTSEDGTTQAADSPAKEPTRSRTSESGTTQAAGTSAKEAALPRAPGDDAALPDGRPSPMRRGGAAPSGREPITPSVRDIRLTGEEPLDAAVKAAEQAISNPESAPALAAAPVYGPELTYRTLPEGEHGEDTPPGPPASGAAHPHSPVEEAAQLRAAKGGTAPAADGPANKSTRPRTPEDGTTQAADSPAKEPARSRASEDSTTQAAGVSAKEAALPRTPGDDAVLPDGRPSPTRRGGAALSGREPITPSVRDIRLTGEKPLDAAAEAAEQALLKPESTPPLTEAPVYGPELTYRTPPEGERGEDTPPGPPASGAAHPHSSAEGTARHRAKGGTTPASDISANKPSRPRASEGGAARAADSPANKPARPRTSEGVTARAADSPANKPAQLRASEDDAAQAAGISAKEAARPRAPGGGAVPPAGRPSRTRRGGAASSGHKPVTPSIRDIRLAGEGVFSGTAKAAEQAAQAAESQTAPFAPGAGPELAHYQAPEAPPDAWVPTQRATERRQTEPGRQGPLTPTVQDIRLFHGAQIAPAADETTQWEPVSEPFSRELSPETMAYRTEQVGQSAADGRRLARQHVRPAPQRPARSAASETVRAGMTARADSPYTTHTWPRQRLANLTHLPPGSARGTRTGPALYSVFQSEAQTQESVAPAPEPLELTYGVLSAQGLPEAAAGRAQPPGKPPVRAVADSDFVRSLPEWAQRFLREGAPHTQAGAVQSMGTARDIATLELPGQPEITEWTAPYYHQEPAPVTFRERQERQRQQTQVQTQEIRISDTEIRRTADRVYQIIEDRIRHERRRLGL